MRKGNIVSHEFEYILQVRILTKKQSLNHKTKDKHGGPNPIDSILNTCGNRER